MIVYRVFEGDQYMHFSGKTKALDVADKIADEENCGDNGFVVVDKLIVHDFSKKRLVLMALNGQSVVETAERIYERMAR